MDYAIDVEVPDENIVRRMSGRRACLDCGATYHVVYNPAEGRKASVMSAASELVLRDDDQAGDGKEETGCLSRADPAPDRLL